MNDRMRAAAAVPASAIELARSLNLGCDCRSLDPETLRHQLEDEPALHGLAAEIARSRPHLFSATAVFIAPETLQAMAGIVEAVETVVGLPGYRTEVLARAPSIAHVDSGPSGVFMGFDFHLGEHGPQLIEINTNAGGALLNRALAHAQQACCEQLRPHLQPLHDLEGLARRWLDDFLNEWALQGRAGWPCRVAIVDEQPAQQYLYPEFLLFRQLFLRAGIDAVICEPIQLKFREGRLMHEGCPIDLVYNRLTDFYLQAPHLADLRSAYLSGAVVLTPHPHAHALYADKRNLALLTDSVWLTSIGTPDETRETLLAGIPATVEVQPAKAQSLWAARRELFFKPASGFGSRAAYRGDKLTQRVWRQIVEGGYVAQAVVPPSARRVRVEGKSCELKLDLRAYVYMGQIELLAARLYSGQTTNFRTPGGGFAPVFVARPDELV